MGERRRWAEFADDTVRSQFSYSGQVLLILIVALLPVSSGYSVLAVGVLYLLHPTPSHDDKKWYHRRSG